MNPIAPKDREAEILQNTKQNLVSTQANQKVHVNSQNSENEIFLDGEYVPIELPKTMAYSLEISTASKPNLPIRATDVDNDTGSNLIPQNADSYMVRPISEELDRIKLNTTEPRERSHGQKNLNEIGLSVDNYPVDNMPGLLIDRAGTPNIEDLLQDDFDVTSAYTPAPESAHIHANPNLDYDDELSRNSKINDLDDKDKNSKNINQLKSASSQVNNNVQNNVKRYRNTQDSENEVYLDNEYAPIELPDTMVYSPEISTISKRKLPDSPSMESNEDNRYLPPNLFQSISNPTTERPKIIKQSLIEVTDPAFPVKTSLYQKDHNSSNIDFSSRHRPDESANQTLDSVDVFSSSKVNDTLVRIPTDVQSMVAQIEESPIENETSKVSPAKSTIKSISPITPYFGTDDSPVVSPPVEFPAIQKNSTPTKLDGAKPLLISERAKMIESRNNSYDSKSSETKPMVSKMPPVSARYHLQNPEETAQYDEQRHEPYYVYQQGDEQYYDPQYAIHGQYVVDSHYTDLYTHPRTYVDPHTNLNAYVDAQYSADRHISHHNQYYEQYDPRTSQFYESSQFEYYHQEQNHESLSLIQVEPYYDPTAAKIYETRNYSQRYETPQDLAFRNSKAGVEEYHNSATILSDINQTNDPKKEKSLLNNTKRFSTISQSTDRFCCGCFKSRKKCQFIMIPLAIFVFLFFATTLFFIYPRAPDLKIETLKVTDTPVIGTAPQFKAASNAAPFVASFKLLADVSLSSKNYIPYSVRSINFDGLIYDPRDTNNPVPKKFINGNIENFDLAANTVSKLKMTFEGLYTRTSALTDIFQDDILSALMLSCNPELFNTKPVPNYQTGNIAMQINSNYSFGFLGFNLNQTRLVFQCPPAITNLLTVVKASL